MKIYTFLAFVSYLIRNYCISNPFATLGDTAEAINVFFGFFLIPITYFMVGLIYRKNSNPLLGSMLFLVIYIANSYFTYFVMKLYPMIWLMIVLVIAYFILIGYLAYEINSNIC